MGLASPSRHWLLAVPDAPTSSSIIRRGTVMGSVDGPRRQPTGGRRDAAGQRGDRLDPRPYVSPHVPAPGAAAGDRSPAGRTAHVTGQTRTTMQSRTRTVIVPACGCELAGVAGASSGKRCPSAKLAARRRERVRQLAGVRAPALAHGGDVRLGSGVAHTAIAAWAGALTVQVGRAASSARTSSAGPSSAPRRRPGHRMLLGERAHPHHVGGQRPLTVFASGWRAAGTPRPGSAARPGGPRPRPAPPPRRWPAPGRWDSGGCTGRRRRRHTGGRPG